MTTEFKGAGSGEQTYSSAPCAETPLRTTGAGFCYNIGRIAAAFGTVFFGLFSNVGDFRLVLLYVGFLIPLAMAVAWFLPDLPKKEG